MTCPDCRGSGGHSCGDCSGRPGMPCRCSPTGQAYCPSCGGSGIASCCDGAVGGIGDICNRPAAEETR